MRATEGRLHASFFGFLLTLILKHVFPAVFPPVVILLCSRLCFPPSESPPWLSPAVFPDLVWIADHQLLVHEALLAILSSSEQQATPRFPSFLRTLFRCSMVWKKASRAARLHGERSRVPLSERRHIFLIPLDVPSFFLFLGRRRQLVNNLLL